MSSYTEALERLQQMEHRYDEAVALMAGAEEAVTLLEETASTMRPLMDAYSSTWLADLEALTDALASGELAQEPRLAVSAQDSVWDLHVREHEVMVRLMRLCAGYFTAER